MPCASFPDGDTFVGLTRPLDGTYYRVAHIHKRFHEEGTERKEEEEKKRHDNKRGGRCRLGSTFPHVMASFFLGFHARSV